MELTDIDQVSDDRSIDTPPLRVKLDKCAECHGKGHTKQRTHGTHVCRACAGKGYIVYKRHVTQAPIETKRPSLAAERMADARCVRCGAPQDNETLHCNNCREIINENHRERRALERLGL